ncbi:MAG: hypothetical protein JW712_12615 [Dehalococcoidales bacterium]|nr:hypothetical protein [Dehalococcoidales bacterium]
MTVEKQTDMVIRRIDDFSHHIQSLPENLFHEKIDEWDSSCGVKYQGEPVTIRNTIDGLTGDYIHHKAQIQEWLNSRQST